MFRKIKLTKDLKKCYNYFNESDRERGDTMSFINNDSVTFTGREMKAVAKFCGLGGNVFITKNAMYAFDAKRACAMRIKYHETYVVTHNPCDTDPDKPKIETVRVDAFERFESAYLIQNVQPFEKLKVGDSVQFLNDGKVLVNSATSDIRTFAVNGEYDGMFEYVDNAVDAPVECNNENMSVQCVALAKIAGIVDGFKINDDKSVYLAFIDPSSGKKITGDGQYKFIKTPALMVKMAPTMFGGTKANGKRQYMDIDIMYMGLLLEDKAED